MKIYFNPRSPHGERHLERTTVTHGIRISIHAPRMGSDKITFAVRLKWSISIHAPRMGSDDSYHL